MLEPEKVHALTIQLTRLVGHIPAVGWLLKRMFTAPAHPVHVFGLDFINPVGLAAGYDKDALGWRGLACLGFGHIEVGTVTIRPQTGNPRPRVFRLVEDQGLINRMGFPGKGASFVSDRLRGRKKPGLVVGVNIGKNKDTPLEQASEEYAELFELFAPLADYIAVNISSPNTAGLRKLQSYTELNALMDRLSTVRQELYRGGQLRPIPILVKLAPDLLDQELDEALDVIASYGMDGVIATNTTLDRQGLQSAKAREPGGLSGAPLRKKSLAMVRRIVESTGGRLPVIGAGGIVQPDDARQMLDSGASLVQVYTGLIYSGPGLVKDILMRLED
jgi:dihydroorotate dehydrogenase